MRIGLNEPLYNARLGDRGKWPLVEVRPYLFCFILHMFMANYRVEFSVSSVSYQLCSYLISEQYEA